jgi:hypothetical protein
MTSNHRSRKFGENQVGLMPPLKKTTLTRHIVFKLQKVKNKKILKEVRRRKQLTHREIENKGTTSQKPPKQ